MPADIKRTQELMDELNEEIDEHGYLGYTMERLDGDTRTLELHLVGPEGEKMERPISIILPRR